ncbi:odorant receptor 43a-like [Nylanderia fulva]|uniref:odorant receptor 43a-like n=1 Tax=Nylanderia fulva TaxID=613905 RepID=UPI0010FAF882|nr:odorant receptor 43a-like [Nylanderia fulva]
MVLSTPDIEVDFEWAVKLNRLSLNIIGLWPKIAQSPREKLLCNLRVLFVFLGLTFVILIPSIHALIIFRRDIMLVMDNLQFTLPGISCWIRIAIFWWKKEAIVPIMSMIVEDWIRAHENAQERQIMIRRAQTARIIVTCTYSLMGIACAFVIVLPGFGLSTRLTSNITDPGIRPLPLQTHYVYDITKRPYYQLTFVSQAVYISLAIMSYTGIDNFLGLLIFHICSQLDILKNRLTHLHKYVNSRDMMKSCVVKHIRLLRAINIIEDTYNITLLALFAYFAILFAFYGFRIISFFKCNDIYYAAYDNEWYLADPKDARNLLPILIRGAKPVYLTAGKVFPMTMATFCGLIKTSAGYISVLHTTRN